MFGTEIEATALAVITKDSDTFSEYRGDLEGYFDYPPVKTVWNIYEGVYAKAKRLPTLTELQMLIEKAAVSGQWSTLFTAQVVKVFDTLSSPRTEVSDEVVSSLIREKRIKELKHRLYDLNTTAGLNELSEIIDYLDETRQINLSLDGENLFFPFSDEYIKNPVERLLEEMGDPLFTGFDGIDERTKGLRKRETLMIVAPTGVGKTQLKQQLLVNFASRGYKSLYCYNDNTKGEVLLRLWCNRINRDTEGDLSSDVMSAMLERDRGPLETNLICTEISPGRTKVQDIRKIIRQARRRMGGLDVLVLDYMDLIASERDYGGDKRHAAKEVIDDLAALVKEENILLVTSTQSNRGGLNADVITLENLSEAFAKAFVCAHVWTLTQSLAEKEVGIIRLTSVKSRRKVSLYTVTLNQCPSSLRITQSVIPVVSLFEERARQDNRRAQGRGQP